MKTLNFLSLDNKKVTNVVNALQQLLADFQVHYTNLRDFHWNVKGHGFFILHEKFESLYDGTATKIDEVAERILTLGGMPENRFSEYLKIAKIKETNGVKCGHEAVDHVLDTYKYLIKQERELIAIAEEADDVVTADLITGYLAEQEKMVWMLVAYSTQSCTK